MLWCSMLVLTLACTRPAHATEGGGGAYPNGVEGFLVAALPPPGFYFVNYLVHYSSDRLNDKNGDKVPINFHVNATANASRFLYRSDKGILGGELGAYVILSLVHLSADTYLGSKSKSGIGDITFGPVLSWHFNKNLQAALAFDVTAPTGSYEKTVSQISAGITGRLSRLSA
jgi:hypothetical protein